MDLNASMIPWAPARPRARAIRRKQRKAVEKVERVECGPILEIMEAIGYRPERNSRDRVDFLILRSTSGRTPGITMARALSLEPS